MNWPAHTTDSREFAEDVAPGVARVRPAVFRSMEAPGASSPRSDVRSLTALRAYEPALEWGNEPAMTGHGAALGLARSTPARGEPAHGERRSMLDLPFGLGVRRPDAPARSRSGQQPSAGAKQPSGQQTASTRPEAGGRSAGAAGAASPTALEERLAPLRGISRELIARGMPAALASELLGEILTEFGNQVLESERNARLALVEQLLLRMPSTPFTAPGVPLKGMYVVTGPSGAGKSVFIAHMAYIAAQHEQTDVVLVNTESARIGAAAQMNALGAVFGFDVEHIYTPQELRQLSSRRGAETLFLVETAGWSPRDDADTHRQPWKWQLPSARVVVCVPATAQGDDLQTLLSVTKEHASNGTAAISKTSETRNILPALSALALERQPVGMVVPGPNLAESSGPIDLGELLRSALGVVMPQRKKGRVRC